MDFIIFFAEFENTENEATKKMIIVNTKKNKSTIKNGI